MQSPTTLPVTILVQGGTRPYADLHASEPRDELFLHGGGRAAHMPLFARR
jgi:hypothetical protein